MEENREGSGFIILKSPAHQKSSARQTALPKTIRLEGQLKYLIAACETICVAGCCGIDAFDFSPLNVAAHLSKYGTGIRDSDIEEIRSEIRKIANMAKTLAKDQDGFICQIEGMNQFFREAELHEMLMALSESLSESRRIDEENKRIIRENEILKKWNKVK